MLPRLKDERQVATIDGSGPILLALLLTLGVVLALSLPQLPTLAALLPPWIGLLLRFPRRDAAFALLLGLSLVSWRGGERMQERLPSSRHAAVIETSGRIIDLPRRLGVGTEVETPTTTADWRFDLQPSDPGLPSRLRISWYRSEQLPHAGECWWFRLRLGTLHGSVNPGVIDHELLLLRSGIGANASVLAARPLDCGGRWPWWLSLRQRGVSQMEHWLPEHPGLPWLKALTLGDDSALSEQDWSALRRTGTTHLIAISGFNLAIVAGLFYAMLRWSWPALPILARRVPAQKAASVGAALSGLLYALLAGWDAPVQRAALMLLVMMGALWRDRLRRPFSALALCWMLMLCWQPFELLNPGLWLSFAAVASIFYLSSGRLGSPPFWLQALRMQLGLSLLMLPLGLAWFHGAAWWSPLINVLAVPVVAVLTPILLMALGLALLGADAAVVLLGVCASAVDQLRHGLLWLSAQLPGLWTAAAASPVALLLAGFGAFWLCLPRGAPGRLLLGACALLPLCAALVLPPPAASTTLSLLVMDVGQGAAILIRTRHHQLLYDTGPAWPGGFDAGENIVVPVLLKQGLRELDLLMLSHGDSDHAGGLGAVRQLLTVHDEIGTPQGRRCEPGQRWQWDGIRFEILHPRPGYWMGNNASCVLRVDGAFSVLLTGDIEMAAERALLQRAPEALRAEVMLAPHHGSRSSSSAEFIRAVAPRWVIYPAGLYNRFGHPHPQVRARYQALGVREYWVGAEGALQLDAAALASGQLRGERERRRFWWRARAVDDPTKAVVAVPGATD